MKNIYRIINDNKKRDAVFLLREKDKLRKEQIIEEAKS